MTPISKKTAFDDLKSVFDDLKLENVFDSVELPVEDRIILSPEMSKLIREEIFKEIASIPIGKIVSRIMAKELERRADENEKIKESLNREVLRAGDTIRSQIESLKEDWAKFSEKIRKKYDDLKNELLNQPAYQFGGFSPQFNDLNIGDPATEGSWRIVKSGNDLVIQRLESGAWVEKGGFTA